jgi:phosphoserine phosphatase
MLRPEAFVLSPIARFFNLSDRRNLLRLAIFDLDDTLIAGDSDHAWGAFLVAKRFGRQVKDFEAQNNKFYQQYQAGCLDVTAYLSFACAPLAHFDLPTLTALHAEFMRTIIEPMMLEKARALIAEHQRAGDYTMIITATLDFITQPIAHAFGIETLLAPLLRSKRAAAIPAKLWAHPPSVTVKWSVLTIGYRDKLLI